MVFPIVDGDVLSDSTLNGFLNIKKNFNFPTKVAQIGTTPTEFNSGLIVGASGGIINMASVQATLYGGVGAGSDADLSVNISGANTGNNWFVHQNVSEVPVIYSSVFSSVAGVIFSRNSSGVNIKESIPGSIEIKDANLAVKVYLNGNTNYTAAISGIDVDVTYNQIGSFV